MHIYISESITSLGAEARIFQKNYANTMVADAMAPRVAGAAAAVV